MSCKRSRVAAAESMGTRGQQLWPTGDRVNGEVSKAVEGRRSGRGQTADQVCTQTERMVDLQEDGVDCLKNSLSVPVVASYAIINGEEGDNDRGDEKKVASSRELFRASSDTAIPAMSEEACPRDDTQYKQEPEGVAAEQQSRSRNEKSYECKVCGRNFETAARLKSHSAANACHAPYACRLCSREFHRANELAEHAEAAHADPRMCVLCGRLLSRKDKLENHVRTHTGEQPFECKFCLKRFSRRDRFNEHEKLHRGISFKCGECQKCFSRRDKMKEHFQRSHHDRSEECDWYGGTLR